MQDFNQIFIFPQNTYRPILFLTLSSPKFFLKVHASIATYLIHSDFSTFSNLLKCELPVISWSGEGHLQPNKTSIKSWA